MTLDSAGRPPRDPSCPFQTQPPGPRVAGSWEDLDDAPPIRVQFSIASLLGLTTLASILLSEKTPGSAGGLAEFDSSVDK
jgi:hypothetical protein